MNILRILTTPHSTLTTPSKKVGVIDKKVKRLITDMQETLKHQSDPQGVGLAAPQVGASLRVFIAREDPDSRDEATVFINPHILALEGKPAKAKKTTKKNDSKLEGCLSIPRIWGPVERYQKIHLSYQDIEGRSHTEWFSGLMATIIQHEVDHLEGVLFTARSLEQKQPLYEERGDRLEKIAF